MRWIALAVVYLRGIERNVMSTENESGVHSYIVDFQFPEVKGAGNYYQSAAVHAADFGTALNRAWSEVRARPAIKGRRITTVKCTIIRSDAP